jgi:2-hydroxy-3-keto-5-methylthiopentenyl-1-phosphate phosphatase
MLYAGDYVSDILAASEADVLFAKKDRGKTSVPGIHL